MTQKATKDGHPSLKGKKLAMYEALRKNLGGITAACKVTGFCRKTHYRWLEADENYKFWVETVQEETHDFAENALFKLIHSGNPQAVMFYLKTKAKERGYKEKQEIEVTNLTTDFVKGLADAYNDYKRNNKSDKE